MAPNDFQQLLAKLCSEFDALHAENVKLKEELGKVRVHSDVLKPDGQTSYTKRRHIRSPREASTSKLPAIPIGIASWSKIPDIRQQSAPDIAGVTADYEICSSVASETVYCLDSEDMLIKKDHLDWISEAATERKTKRVSLASFGSDECIDPESGPHLNRLATTETALGIIKHDASRRRSHIRKRSTETVYYRFFAAAFVVLDCGVILWNCSYYDFKDIPLASHVLAAIITAFFIADAAARIYIGRTSSSLHYERDALDALCLAIMVFDQICLITRGSTFKVAWASTVRGSRVLRFFYVLRECVKLGGASHLLREFDWLLSALMSTAGWRTVLCVLFYIAMLFTVCSIALTDGSLYLQCDSSSVDGDPLCEYFGSLRNTYMTLFKVTYGGLLWGDVMDSIGKLSYFYGLLFGLFVLSHAILIVNIGIGAILRICQESTDQQNYLDALRKEAGRQEREIRLIEQLFMEIDTNDNGAISRAEFERAMRDPHLTSTLSVLQLHIFDLHAVFPLFDVNGSGDISLHEFVLGCMRMKGPARALDVIHLQASVRQINDRLASLNKEAAQTPVQLESDGAGENRTDTRPKFLGQSVESWCTMADFAKRQSSSSAVTALSTLKSVADLSSEFGRKFAYKQQSIPRCELRAMSLQELKRIPLLIKEALLHEEWIDWQSGEKLAMEDVNLYHFNYYYMYAKTAPNGVILEGLTSIAVVGDELLQYDCDAADALPLARAVVIETPSNGCVHAAIVHGKFKTNSHPVQSHSGSCGPLAGLQAPGAISFKEYMSPESLQPRWFCSHWWGETVVHFVKCCEEHARRRRLGQGDAAYWVCAYANRQYDLSTEITEDPTASSFFKAIDLAEGVLLFLDKKATPFTRIWCCFEIYITIKSGIKSLDIVTVTKTQGKAKPVLLSDGQLPCESQMAKTDRERDFPLRLLVYGMRADLAKGEATVPSDRANILKVIESTAEIGGEVEVSPVDQANGALNAVFAQAAWIHALQDQVNLEDVHGLSLPIIMSRDTRPKIEFSFEMCPEILNDDVRMFARGLSPYHQDIHLSFGNCKNLSDSVMKDLAAQLPDDLKICRLDFVGCTAITSKGLALLTQGLPHNITNLRLDFACCPEIDMVGVRFLAEHLPKSINKFYATFLGTQVDRNFRSISELQAACGKTMFSRAVRGIEHLTGH